MELPVRQRHKRANGVFRFYGLDFFSPADQDLIASYCGSSHLLDQIVPLGFPWESLTAHDNVETQALEFLQSDTPDLPSRFIVQSCKALYQCSEVGIMYCLVDVDMLDAAIDTAYGSSTPGPFYDIVGARALVFAFTAFCAAAGHRADMPYPVDTTAFALEVERCLLVVQKAPPRIQTMQTLLLLVRASRIDPS
jgi:hypothetical protein